MIDYEAIKAKFVRLASTWLSEDVTAVIQSHLNAPQPDRPYAVLDVLLERDEHGERIHSFVNSDDNPVYEAHKQVVLSYRVVGQGALTLASRLKQMFLLDRIVEEVRRDLQAGVVSVGNVRDLPTKISDKQFDDMAEFEVIINVTDSVTDDQGTVIDSAVFTTQFKQGRDDPDPYTTQFEID